MRIFVAALDWGLGHTTRIMPVVHQLLKQNHQLVIGCSEVQRRFFQEQFTGVTYEKINSSSPVFSKKSTQVYSLLRFIPLFLISIQREKKQLMKLHRKYGFDLVLSDNRYGIHLSDCKNVLITHQLNLFLPKKLRFLNPFVNRKIHHWINKFDICLIPDYNTNIRLAGDLSAIYPTCKPDIKYIGALSRFDFVSDKKCKVPDLLILISGPERQRSVFERIVEDQLAEIVKYYSCLVIRGKPFTDEPDKNGFTNHRNSEELKYLIQHTKYIITRSGYSTIMDLVSLGRTAMLVPTPGQSEQEYLAKYLCDQKWFIMEEQNTLNLRIAVKKLEQFIPQPFEWAQESIENFSI